MLFVVYGMFLLIEDNSTIATNIATYLQHHDYLVDIAPDAEKALELVTQKRYDCLICDVMLPGMDGFALVQQVRENSSTPIIMTTAKGTIDDKQTGFDLGADDYLVKPFELRELLMRIEALLKRSQPDDIYAYADIQIHTDTNEIYKKGTKTYLPHKERLLLSTLLNNEGYPVSRAEISEAVRGEESLREKTDNKLDVYISNLRRKLDKGLIETVKGYGYKIPRR